MSSLRNLVLAVAATTLSTFSFAQATSVEQAAENAGAEIRQEGAEAVNATENAAERAGATVDRATDAAATEATTTTTTTTEVEVEQEMRAPRADRN